METITIEKWLKFNNVIDNLNELNVLKDVEYEIKDENQALLKVRVTGNLKTSVSNEIIEETILGMREVAEEIGLKGDL